MSINRSTETKRGGSAYIGVGNDGFRKYSVNVSTGLMDNGWSVTFMGSLNKGDGYIKGTNFEGWTYFGNISKVINANHKLSLTAFGAPMTATSVVRNIILKIIKTIKKRRWTFG